MEDFISGDDLIKSFDKWLEYQGVDAAATDTNGLKEWRRIFEEMAALFVIPNSLCYATTRTSAK